MDNITYNELSTGAIAVYLKGIRVGSIEQVAEGWQYAPRGSKIRGEVFKSVEGVKRSLEGED